MSLAQRLNEAKITPSFCLVGPDGKIVDDKELSIDEIGSYSQYPVDNVYVIDKNGEEAKWSREKWVPNA